MEGAGDHGFLVGQHKKGGVQFEKILALLTHLKRVCKGGSSYFN